MDKWLNFIGKLLVPVVDYVINEQERLEQKLAQLGEEAANLVDYIHRPT